jgi:branched-chain amino acid aminotransferase
VFVYLNDRIVPESEALVSVTDRGFLFGDGVFETLRSYGGRPFMLSAHLERFVRSAHALGIRLTKTEAAIRDALMQSLDACGLKDAYIRIMVSRGSGPAGHDPKALTEPTFVIVVRQFTPYPEQYYTEGVRLIVSRTRRNPPEALNPAIKSANFLNNILAKGEASEAGAYDALMLNMAGKVAECTVSNIFFARGGELHTPSLDCGILDGVTRKVAIMLARRMGIEVREGSYEPHEIYSADEVFTTSSTTEVLPVRMVDAAVFQPGALARALKKEYEALALSGKEPW